MQAGMQSDRQTGRHADRQTEMRYRGDIVRYRGDIMIQIE